MPSSISSTISFVVILPAVLLLGLILGKMNHQLDGCNVVKFPGFSDHFPDFEPSECYDFMAKAIAAAPEGKEGEYKLLAYFFVTFVRLEAAFALGAGFLGLYAISLPFSQRHPAHIGLAATFCMLTLVDSSQGLGVPFGKTPLHLIEKDADEGLIPFAILWSVLSAFNLISALLSRAEASVKHKSE